MNAIKDLIKLLEKGNCEVSQSLYNLSKREKELKEMKRKFRGSVLILNSVLFPKAFYHCTQNVPSEV